MLYITAIAGMLLGYYHTPGFRDEIISQLQAHERRVVLKCIEDRQRPLVGDFTGPDIQAGKCLIS